MWRVDTPSSVPRSLVAGAVASVPFVVVCVLRFGLSVPDPVPRAVFLVVYRLLGPLVLVGVPVTLYLEYGTVTPAVVAGLLVGVASLERSPGETPAFVLLVVWWPFCLGAYLALAGIEYAIRNPGSVRSALG